MTFQSTRRRLKALQGRFDVHPTSPSERAHAAAVAAEIEWAEECVEQVMAASRRGELVSANPAAGLMTLTGGRVVALPKKKGI